jgi:uncharacterized protein
MQATLERAFADFLLGPELRKEDLSAWLAGHGLSDADRKGIAEADFQRLLLYRSLVRHTLWETLELSIPRTMARMGSVFAEYFDRFLSERGPRTHYVRDVTAELLAFCEPLWATDPRVHAYLPELARHEALRIEVGSLPASAPAHERGELALDRGVCFIQASRLMSYRHAVHELSDDPKDTSSPVQRETRLFVYRSPEHEVRYLELSPLADAIVARLLRGERLGSAVQHACQAQGSTLDAGVLEGTARLLADLAERGALLGRATA